MSDCIQKSVSYSDPSATEVEISWVDCQKKTNEISGGLETSFQINQNSLKDVARQRFRDLLKDTWPGSDKDTAARASRMLGVSPKTVLNWLACTHSAPFEIVFAIGCFTGVYRVMDVMTRGQGRLQVLNLFAKGVRRVLGK